MSLKIIDPPEEIVELEKSSPRSKVPARFMPIAVAEDPPSLTVKERPVWLPEAVLGTVTLVEMSKFKPKRAEVWVA